MLIPILPFGMVLSAQVIPYSINSGGDLNSSVGILAVNENAGMQAIVVEGSSSIE